MVIKLQETMKIYFHSLLVIVFFIYYENTFAFQTNRNKSDTITFATICLKSNDKNVPDYSCNEFVMNAFSSGFKLKTLIKNKNDFFNISKEPVVNIHDSAVVDTAYFFSNRKNEISIYKAVHAELINRFDVSDKRFILYGGIRVGITKEAFQKKFRIKSLKNDTVAIGDEDNIAKFYFYFRKSVLVRINYKAFID